jgi:hypothetical protein
LLKRVTEFKDGERNQSKTILGKFEAGREELTECGLTVSNRNVHVMLLPVLVNREPLKVDIPSGSKMGLHGPGKVNGAPEAEVGHAVLDDFKVDGNNTRHLDSTTKGNFSITL